MNKDFNRKVGRLIYDKRRDKRMTQVDLAKRLGIAQSTLACYETGTRGMDLDTFFEICRILELDPNVAQDLL